jgi:catechol 2,3-dioxygenase
MVTERMDVEGVAAAATAGDGGGVPPGTDIGHVHLEVTDLAAARAFYVEGLGLGLRQEWGGAALFLAAGGYHHHVGLNTWNGRSEPASGRGLDRFELVLPDGESLAAARERLRADGAEVTDTDQGVAVADPDGVRIDLRSDG